MSLRWIMLVLLVAWGVNAFALISDFNEIIAETAIDQHELAAEIQTQVGVTKEKTLKTLTEKDSVALKGFNLRIFN